MTKSRTVHRFVIVTPLLEAEMFKATPEPTESAKENATCKDSLCV